MGVCGFIFMCGPEKTACWLVKEGPVDSPAPAGVGLKLPADIHTVAAGLIACLSSLKGKAAAHFILLLSAFVAEQSRVSSQSAVFPPVTKLYLNIWACLICFTALVRFSRMY